MLYFFINMAEHSGGLTARTAGSIMKKKKKKYVSTGEVESVSVEPLLIDEQKNEFHSLQHITKSLRGLALLWYQKSIKLATKTYISAHGHPNDPDNIYVGTYKFGETMIAGRKLGSVGDLSAFFAKIMTDTTLPYRLSLMICYAARSKKYKKGHDALSDLKDSEIRSSLAFKLFHLLCKRCPKLRMSAGTGSIEYDMLGRRMVNTTEGMKLALERERIFKKNIALKNKVDLYLKNQAKAEAITEISQNYQYLNRGYLKEEEYAQIEKNINVLSTQEKKVIRKYLDIYAIKLAKIDEDQKKQQKRKFGVMRYQRRANKIIVTMGGQERSFNL